MIKDQLIQTGYRMSNKGTICLIECIELICRSDNYMEVISNLEKNVYRKISEKYRIKLSTLKSLIEKATNNANILTGGDLTPKAVIIEVVYKIKEDIKDDKNKVRINGFYLNCNLHKIML